MAFCPDCGIDRYDQDLTTPCQTCKQAAKDTAKDAKVRTGDGDDELLSAADTKDQIETADADQLDELETNEQARPDGPRSSVTKAIKIRRDELKGVTPEQWRRR